MNKSQLFFDQVHQTLQDTLQSLDIPEITEFLEKNPLHKSLSFPPEFQLGQLAFPCFPFARFLRKAPPVIAQEWAALMTQKQLPLISKVEAVNGYLNFHCDVQNFFQEIYKDIDDSSFFQESFLDQKEKISVEYSQPNTHKALHIGHLRNLVYGDAVCNFLDHIGHQSVRTTYPGDLGTHIAKSLWYIQKSQSPLPEQDKALWLGKIYALAGQKIKELSGDEELRAKEEITQILKSLQEQKGESYDLYLKTREWSLEEMRNTYAWLGSHFDQWYFESECDIPSRELVQEKFQEGLFVESEGAIGLNLNPYELGFALLLKKDGNGLYLTKDLELIKRKFSDSEISKALYVVDSRQKLHFQQLFKTAELMGFEQAKNSLHLSYESVTDADGKAFSSRDLKGISLDDLRKRLEEKVLNQYLEKNKGTWSDEEIQECAQNIVIAALKYGMLRVDPGSTIKFIEEQWLSLEGETGPYLLYVYSRCRSLLEKAEGKVTSTLDHSKLRLYDPTEKELLYEITKFNKIAHEAAIQYRPNLMTQYLFHLCKLFNRFYKECSVLNAPAELLASRIALVKSTQNTLAEGLKLLGIPLIRRM